MIRSFQQAINDRLQCLQVDGAMGPKTMAAFNSLSKGDRQALAAKYSKVLDDSDDQEDDSNESWISLKEANDLADKISRAYELPKGFLRLVLELEPEKKRSNGDTLLNLKSRTPSGSFYGLSQMGKPAFQDAKRVDPHDALRGVAYSDLDDAAVSLHAAASFAVANIRYLRDSMGDTFDVTPELLYVAHNQGWGGAKRALEGTFEIEGGQSPQAVAVYKKVSQQA